MPPVFGPASAVEELLDDEASVGLGEAGAGVLDGDVSRVGDDDALARGQAVVLDDVRCTERVEGGLDLLHRRADVSQGGRHVGRGHDLLRERLAALETGRLRGGSEDGKPGLTAHVRDACDERGLGTDD